MSMNPFCELAVEQLLRLREGKVPSTVLACREYCCSEYWRGQDCGHAENGIGDGGGQDDSR